MTLDEYLSTRGLSLKAFCDQHGLRPATFYAHRGSRRQDGAPRQDRSRPDPATAELIERLTRGDVTAAEYLGYPAPAARAPQPKALARKIARAHRAA